MTKVTMLEFRRDARGVLQRLARGERFLLSHRGKAVARLEPVEAQGDPDPETDLFLTIGRRARRSPRGRTKHAEIDRILYGDS